MKRNAIIAGAVAIALASTAVIATAHDRGDGPRGMRGGPEMLFERFDVNGDGAITKDEIAAAADGPKQRRRRAATLQKPAAQVICEGIKTILLLHNGHEGQSESHIVYWKVGNLI